MKGRRDFSDFSKCNGCQFQFKGFEKVTGEIDFHNSSSFSSKTSDWSPTADTNIDPQKIYDLRICDYSGPAGQRGAVMVDNQNENLQWKIFLNSTPRPNQIFRCIEEELSYFVSKNYHGVSMVFSGESWTHKCSRTGSNEASSYFINKIQKTKFDSSMDRRHDSSLLAIYKTRETPRTNI